MPTDSESVPSARRSSTSSMSPGPKKKKKKKVVRKPIARPLSETEINAPDRQTLVMLAVLAGLSVVLWIFAHKGCNYHPPRETRRPRDVTTAELVREPKDAAIEFQQRLLTLDYAGALEIAGGPLVEKVKTQLSSCAPKDPACIARRQKLANVITTAVLVDRTPFSAKAIVTTHRLPTGDASFLTLVERDASGWKVTAQVPNGPDATLPAPSLAPPETPSVLRALPLGSAAPASSH